MTFPTNTGTPVTPPPNYQYQVAMQQPPKKKGCGCCLWGCFLLLILSVVALIGGYFGMRYVGNWVMSDDAVVWVYQNVARDKIRQALPPNWSDAQKDKFMTQSDATLQEYLTMPPEQKKVIKQEALIFVEYHSKGQVVPHDKIPNLKAFVEKQMKAFEEAPTNSPQLLQ